MTANHRIALNIVATYGRSLYALAIGLFSSRWVLMSLEQTDLGLYGVVGGLTVLPEASCEPNRERLYSHIKKWRFK